MKVEDLKVVKYELINDETGRVFIELVDDEEGDRWWFIKKGALFLCQKPEGGVIRFRKPPSDTDELIANFAFINAKYAFEFWNAIREHAVESKGGDSWSIEVETE